MKGKPRKNGRIVSDAEFRRMWMDLSLSQNEIGRRLGISGEAVRFRAASRKFPPRPKSRPFARRFDHDRIVRLYQAGLAMHVIAEVQGCTASVVRHALDSAGIKRRSRHDPGGITAAEFMRRALAARASKEQAALAKADMVDRFQTARWAGRAA